MGDRFNQSQMGELGIHGNKDANVGRGAGGCSKCNHEEVWVRTEDKDRRKHDLILRSMEMGKSL